jgi:TRAP-type mannitol/chloroaromatic compound transport system permease small subunit
MLIVGFVLLLLQTISELIKLGAVLRGREDVAVEELETGETPLRIE